MHRHSLFFAGLAMAVLPLSAHSPAQANKSCLKPGDILPPLAGQALTGKWVDFASVLGGNPAVVVFSFSRAGAKTRRRGLDDS